MGNIRRIISYASRSGTERVRVLSALAVVACLVGACSSKVDDLAASITPPPRPASPRVARLEPVQDPAIAIETPLDHDEVGSPVSVTGTADVVGDQVTVRVLGGNGSELAAADVQVRCRKGCPGTFGTELFFFVGDREPGWIQVSGEAEQGRSAISTVPVVLFPA